MDMMAKIAMVLMECSRKRPEEAGSNHLGDMMRTFAGMLMNEEINRHL